MQMDELKPEGIPVESDTFSKTGIMSGSASSAHSAAFAEAAQEQQPEEVQQEAPQEQAPVIDPVKERNFRAIRQEADRAARERDDALRRLDEYERRYAPPQRQVEPEVDIENEIDLNMKDDELIEGKQIKSVLKKMAAQQKAFQRRSQESTAESRLRLQYNDFDKVMTIDNMRTFSDAYPELAKSINSTNDLYDKAVSAYQLIKKFGIYEENAQPYAAEKERAISNTAKPKPLASIAPQQGDSPLSRANAFAGGLTEALKEQLRKEMAEAIRKY